MKRTSVFGFSCFLDQNESIGTLSATPVWSILLTREIGSEPESVRSLQPQNRGGRPKWCVDVKSR